MKTEKPEMYTCSKCGWVHFAVSLKEAQHSVASFNTYFASLTLKQQKEYYGGKGASMATYLSCFLCGNKYTGFRKYKEGDCPDGCTIQPILNKKEKYPNVQKAPKKVGSSKGKSTKRL